MFFDAAQRNAFMKINLKTILITLAVLILLSGAGLAVCFLLAKNPPKKMPDTTDPMVATITKHIKTTREAYILAKLEAEEAARAEAAAKEAARKAEEEAKRAEEAAKAEAAAKEAAEKEALEKEAAKLQAARDAAKKEGEALVDRNAPIFIYYRANPTLKVGDEFDIHKYIGYADDVDRDVELNVTGSVDTSTVGSYPLEITLKDDEGRTTTKNMEVNIVTEIASGGSDSTPVAREQFSDFVNAYKTDNTYVGIDVSRWQEDIDFEKVKNAGCEFAYIRLGGYDNGEHFTDRYFVQNFKRAKEAGIMRGIYWYSEESSLEEIEASVAYLMEVLGGEPLDFPIAYDWEDYRNFEKYHMNLFDLNMCYEYFEQEVEKYGYTACLYGSKNAQINYWTRQKKSPVWLAHYTTATTYEGDYFMWQHANTGRIDGISGDVDLDVYYPERLGIN